MAKGITWNAYEDITVAGTAVGFTATGANSIAGQRNAFITVEGAPIRVRLDGTAATATVGTLVRDGGDITLGSIESLSRFSAIRTTGTSATIRCHYGY